MLKDWGTRIFHFGTNHILGQITAACSKISRSLCCWTSRKLRGFISLNKFTQMNSSKQAQTCHKRLVMNVLSAHMHTRICYTIPVASLPDRCLHCTKWHTAPKTTKQCQSSHWNRSRRPRRGVAYSSTLSLTSALDGGGWSTPRPATLPPGKPSCPLYGWLRVPQGRCGHVRKISSPPGFNPRTVQPVQWLNRLRYSSPQC